MRESADHKPIALWIDDSVAEMSPFVAEMLNEGLSGEFELVLLGDTDEAVEFTLAHSDRIFMFIQDSTRAEGGKVIPAWKKLRPAMGPSIGYQSHQGEFYTYVIDAYAPFSGVVFSGFSFTALERNLIAEWGHRDPRIILADKMALTSPRLREEEKPGLFKLGLEQLERWRRAKLGHELSGEGELVAPVAEELVALCGSRSQHIDKLSPRQFEEMVAAIFKNHGFSVELTSRTRDGGYDIIATSHTGLSPEVSLIEVKHFAPNRPVGVGIVRALYGVKHLHEVSKVLLVTSSYLTNDAKREFSRVIPWELEFFERSKVLEWCKTYLTELLEEPEGDTDRASRNDRS